MENPYFPNSRLSVQPTETESQYEAYQSIFAAIMFAHYPPITEEARVAEMSPYELLCAMYGIKLYTLDRSGYSKGNGIYFKPGRVTHYIAYKDGKELNPYTFFQPKDTQGFCQMFAFFLYTGDIAVFQQVDQSRKINASNFEKLVNNTYECGRKAIQLVKSIPNVYAKFTALFPTIAADPQYGVKAGTKVEKYLTEFSGLPRKTAMYYIYDQPLVGWPGNRPKQELWDEIEKVAGGNRRRKTKRRL